ncbi:hypothetical protein [Amycolatopsis sp. NPDC051903]|uniref:hypothetical protein n=1 Tax=Amycolatopsis sp. NPDC051903 TaxID=3363936 RepID=UPI0037ADB14E
MDTKNLTEVTGTRMELVAELRRLAQGWDHLGKPDLARASEAGADRLLMGEGSVQVGHTRYKVQVTEPTP